MQYHHERKFLRREFDDLSRRRPLRAVDQKRYDALVEDIGSKRFQEDECVNELKLHNSRDARIRGYVKSLSDYFKEVEISYRSLRIRQGQSREVEHVEWNFYADRACITHQDDMSKVDLPHFVLSASSDITRWRFGGNAHVSSITNDAIVLSQEQGSGAKNSSAIVEEILH